MRWCACLPRTGAGTGLARASARDAETQQLGARARVRARNCPVLVQRLADLRTDSCIDGWIRSSGPERMHRDAPAAADPRHSSGWPHLSCPPVGHRAAGGSRPAGSASAHDRLRGNAPAPAGRIRRPPPHLALLQRGSRRARLHDYPAIRVKHHAELVEDPEDGLISAIVGHRLNLGSVASRSPSPITVTPGMVK